MIASTPERLPGLDGAVPLPTGQAGSSISDLCFSEGLAAPGGTAPWVLVVLLASALCAVATYHVWLSHGGSRLQALGAGGTAGAAAFGIGITLLNTLS